VSSSVHGCKQQIDESEKWILLSQDASLTI
jgi:hypothetical protein